MYAFGIYGIATRGLLNSVRKVCNFFVRSIELVAKLRINSREVDSMIHLRLLRLMMMISNTYYVT